MTDYCVVNEINNTIVKDLKERWEYGDSTLRFGDPG